MKLHMQVITILAAALAAAGADGASFNGLGDLTGGSFSSIAHAVSADGSTVVGSSNSANGLEAFRWRVGAGMTGLGDLPGGSFESIAYGVSGDGLVVVGGSRGLSGGREPFRWTATSLMVNLGPIPFGGPGGHAYSTSLDGSVIVGEGSDVFGAQAFRWTAGGGMVRLGGMPDGWVSVARATSSDGSVSVGEGNYDGVTMDNTAIRWASVGNPQSLGMLDGGTASSAYSMTADGLVVVGSSSSTAEAALAFRWTAAAGMTSLDDIPGGLNRSWAYAVSADGSVVVGKGNGPAGEEAFIWDATHGARSLKSVLTSDYGLSLTGWTLIEARGISADGNTIVGAGLNPSGSNEAWIVRLNETIVTGDLNGDGVVNTLDLGILLSSWSLPATAPACGGSKVCPADINGDGFVNSLDLGILLSHWSL